MSKLYLRDVPEGKLAVITHDSSWKGFCVYRDSGGIYFVGMKENIKLNYEFYSDITVRIVGSIEVGT